MKEMSETSSLVDRFDAIDCADLIKTDLHQRRGKVDSKPIFLASAKTLFQRRTKFSFALIPFYIILLQPMLL